MKIMTLYIPTVNSHPLIWLHPFLFGHLGVANLQPLRWPSYLYHPLHPILSHQRLSLIPRNQTNFQCPLFSCHQVPSTHPRPHSSLLIITYYHGLPELKCILRGFPSCTYLHASFHETEISHSSHIILFKCVYRLSGDLFSVYIFIGFYSYFHDVHISWTSFPMWVFLL